VHGVGGVLGVICLGLFATTAVNSAGANGLFNGGPGFFGKELIAVAGAAVYAFLFTYAMLWLINKVTKVHVSAADEEAGLDASVHGEAAYL